MKTLEQWQKELPGYSVWQGEQPGGWDMRWKELEVFINGAWSFFEWTDGRGAGVWNHSGNYLCPTDLASVGAIFRRKKERQREFKIEYDQNFGYKIDGDETVQFVRFFEKENIKSATLTVNEWGGE